MHGLSMADDIIKAALEDKGKSGGKNIKEIRVKCGRYVFSETSELEEAYRLLAEDTPLKGVPLVVELVDGRVCVLDRVVYE